MPDRPKIRLTLLLAIATLAGCDQSATGVRAYREGRYEDAVVAFAEAEKAAGDGASAELLYDEALAALRTGKLALAEASVDKAAMRGGPEFTALRDFVRGNTAFARSATSEVQASRPEAEPFAFDVAIAQAESSRSAWQRAATSRDDWPEARRNVERAALAVERLKMKKAEAEKNRRQRSNPKPNLKAVKEKKPDGKEEPQKQPDQSKGDGEDSGAKPSTATEEAELPPAEVARLLEKLAEREREKIGVRRARRDVKSSDVEKDW